MSTTDIHHAPPAALIRASKLCADVLVTVIATILLGPILLVGAICYALQWNDDGDLDASPEIEFGQTE